MFNDGCVKLCGRHGFVNGINVTMKIPVGIAARSTGKVGMSGHTAWFCVLATLVKLQSAGGGGP